MRSPKRRIRVAPLRIMLAVVLVSLFASAAMGAPVVIQMQRSIREADRSWQEAVVEEFNQEHDHIKVELAGGGEGIGYGKLQVLIIAAEAPHIIYQDPNNLLNMARQGALVDLKPYLDREPNDSPFRDFFEVTWSFYTLAGRIYGVAMDLQTQALMYNVDAFNEAGQVEPWSGWTWTDLTAMAKKLTKRPSPDAPPSRWGIREPQWFHWWSTIWHFGGELVDDWSDPQAFTGDTEEVRRALRVYQELVRAGAMSPPGTFGTSGSGGTSANVVGYGLSAMGLANSLYMQSAIPLGLEFKTNWNIASLPSGPAGNTAITNAIGWALVRDSGDTKEAFDVLRYFSGPTAMELAVQHRRGAVLPHRPTMLRSWLRYNTIPSNCRVLLDALPTSRPLPLIEDSYKNTVSRAAYEFWRDQISEEQAIENMRIGIISGIEANRAGIKN
ncbi:MAG: extracellular solute-binding protein [Firmicutes bacterium]|nr:extracellular solute-binding protein [Bacillota bacterium]